MRILLIVTLLLASHYSFSQANFKYKVSSFLHLVQPRGKHNVIYKEPTPSKKAFLYVLVTKQDWFFEYDTDIKYANAVTCNKLIQNYILRDSIKYFDTLGVTFVDSNLVKNESWKMSLNEYNPNMPLWEKVACITDAMPVTCSFYFDKIGNNQYDIKIIILGEEWALRNSVYELDTYGQVVGVIAFDMIVKPDMKKYRKIIIRTVTNDLIPIHEKVYNIADSYLFQSLYPQLY